MLTLACSQLPAATLFGVAGKVVVVTGGGSGIGAMIAMGFVRNGAKTYIVSRKDTSAFAAEVQARAGADGQCIALQADLGTNAGVAQLVQELGRLEPGGVDVLVNNSGTNWAAALSDYTPTNWDKVYALNVRGVFDLTRLLVPSLERASQRSGQPSRVINISSIGTRQCEGGGAGDCVTARCAALLPDPSELACAPPFMSRVIIHLVDWRAQMRGRSQASTRSRIRAARPRWST